ncbi:hypothetical protein CF640_36700, partial [Burkholderia pseudomallei]
MTQRAASRAIPAKRAAGSHRARCEPAARFAGIARDAARCVTPAAPHFSLLHRAPALHPRRSRCLASRVIRTPPSAPLACPRGLPPLTSPAASPLARPCPYAWRVVLA